MALLHQRAIRCEIQFEIGNSLIADARNRLVAKFLASAATDLVFIDGAVRYDRADPTVAPESDFLIGQPAAAAGAAR